MLSYDSIKEIQHEAARAAEDSGLEPLSARGFDPAAPLEFIRRIPFLGDYVPAGWEHPEALEDLLVDSSGFGSENEPALTVDQFTKRIQGFARLDDGHGFGIYEAGQFQVVIRIYTPDRRDFTGTGGLTAVELNKIRAR